MRARASGFTLVELLIVVAIISLLLAIMMPSLAHARSQARSVKCRSNLRQLGIALTMYAGDYRGRTMPLAYTDSDTVRDGGPLYWWGGNNGTSINHTRGFTWPYLSSDLKKDGVYECPEQPWGSYRPQANENSITSTYGYNGYYLCSPYTPGYQISARVHPWLLIEKVREPGRTFAFADTMIELAGELRNCALLDPPMLYVNNHRWNVNDTPTTAFRHRGDANLAFVDGHVQPRKPGDRSIVVEDTTIGWVGESNDPGYVPDFREW